MTKSEFTYLQSIVTQEQLRTSDALASVLKKHSSRTRNLTEMLSQLSSKMTILDSRVYDLEEVNITTKQSLNTLATKEHYIERQLVTLLKDLNTTLTELLSMQNTVSQDQLRISDELVSLINNYSSNVRNVSEMLLQLKSHVTILDSYVYDFREDVNSTINRSLKTIAALESNNEKQFETLSNDLKTTQNRLSFLQTTISQDQFGTSNQQVLLTKSESTILRSVSEISQLKSLTTSLDSRIHVLEKEYISKKNSGVRLVDGNFTGEGRVEVTYNGQWGTVCDDSFTDTNAQVVCRQLGYEWNGAIQKQRAPYGQGTGAIVLDNVSCRGTEKSIASCQHNGFTKENCVHSEDVGVVCFSVRLTGGSSSREGTVVVTLGNTEGSVCDDHWDTDEARVVCRMLGYTG
ncbi:deleted in malignant brain tumors 1 protein-like, partial [Saccostrea cucullata]|uniref:deleted in malignant brain tumors 1 protein-like n=1 Tax=Saccostrea cuccullata TaxID=36930 RepID=UPI002ED576FD